LKDLPAKTERIEWCEMTELQRSIYRDALQRSRKTVLAAQEDHVGGPSGQRWKKSRDTNNKQQAENSTNVLMDLRKAASHPMLFRSRYTDETLAGMTKQLLKEPDFKKRGALFDLVKEDMSVMTDAELQVFCATYKVGLFFSLKATTHSFPFH
jgi:SWI/SNF-related matrix-associated actin-dependent regulator 1 of chromatin subfamily A